TGTVLLESITDGMAKVVSDLNIKTADAPQPLKVQSTIWVHVASGKATKVEGTAKNIPSQGFQIDDLKFTMQLVK
ncbi:MAG TPA: hypothetical protein VM328_03260, partial [Fimbriimonadaceae bacterium]|nr:hypothetical protein [Fimbriimonadaceae bacterium]